MSEFKKLLTRLDDLDILLDQKNREDYQDNKDRLARAIQLEDRLRNLEVRLHYLETINPYTIPIQVYQAPTPRDDGRE